MTDTIKNELMKELKEVKDKYSELIKYDVYNRPDVEDFCFKDNIYCYVIITSNGKKYVINNFTKSFPEFDMNTIVYVCKQYYRTTSDNYIYWDTINDFYNDMTIYSNNVKLFEVNETIGVYED